MREKAATCHNEPFECRTPHRPICVALRELCMRYPRGKSGGQRHVPVAQVAYRIGYVMSANPLHRLFLYDDHSGNLITRWVQNPQELLRDAAPGYILKDVTLPI